MTDEQVNKYGQMAFESYSEVQEWKTFDGRPIPQWESLSHKIKNAWCVAAAVVIEDHVFNMLKQIKELADNKDNFISNFDEIDFSQIQKSLPKETK